MNAHAHDGKVRPHVAPALFYWGILGALVVLTAITVGVSYVDFGAGNTVIAMVVATIKATLVATFFMHLAHDKKFNSVILVMSFVFLGVFLFLTNEDISMRGVVDDASTTQRMPRTAEVAPSRFDGRKLVVAPHTGDHAAPAHH